MVSVIIPAYKAAQYIAETLRSVQAQTHENWEIWVIDDGSPDDLGAIVQTFCAQDPRIHYHRQANAGVSKARNQGYQLAKGEYLAFLDADDVWLPDNLSTKLERFGQDPDFGLVHSDAAVIDQDSKPTGEIKSGKEGHILNDLLRWEETCIPAPSSILVKREVVERVGGFEPSLSNAADFEFFFRVAKQYKIGRVPKVTWQYRVHGNNMHQNMDLMERDELRSYDLATQYNLFESEAFRRECYANMYLILAASWWGHQRRWGKTLYYVFKAIATRPAILGRLFRKVLSKLRPSPKA